MTEIFIFHMLVIWLLVSFFPCLSAKSCNPNVLFLFTDDQRHDTIHALGNKFIHTPHTDKIVKSGVAFKNAYIMGGSSPAVCSPSRASLFSGLTLWNLENQGLWGFEISEKYKTMPQVFRENGYVTFATGKNEPGQKGHFARSFSAGDKILFRGMTRNQYRLPLFPFSPEGDYSSKKAKLHEGKHSSEVYADACIRFLEDHKASDQPFFAYVSFQTPHDPRQSPEKYRSMYSGKDLPLPPSFQPEHPFDNGMLKIRDEMLEKFPRQAEKVKEHIADYYAMITHTDAQIGRILKILEETGKMEDTIIVFTSDNGLAVGRHGLMGKQNVYDHSVHVPLVISGPGIPKGEIRDQLCYIYDLYPTLCERAGLEVPKEVQFRSFNSVLNNPQDKHREHLYFAFMSWQRAIQKDQFKLIEYCVNGRRTTQLYDLTEDPHETRNLAGDPKSSQTLNQLRTLLQEERRSLNDGNSPYDFTSKQGKDFWSLYESVKESETPE
jgi:arylsulfatase A-like enzyme